MSVADRMPRLWTLWMTARPSQLGLILGVYTLGLGMARAHGWTHGNWVTVTTGGSALLAVAVSVHHANEYVDVETDRLTEPTSFSGGSGALERTSVSREVLVYSTTGTLLLGVAIGVVGWFRVNLSTTALVVLVSIAVAGLAYSLPPLALVRRGVGELTNALLGGVLLPLYGVAVVGTVSIQSVVAVLPFTLLVGCNLLATHWPDRYADRAVGKRTLAVRWSRSRIRRAYWALAATATALTVVLTWLVPITVVAAQALALPPLVWGGIVLTRQRSPLPAVSAMVVHATASACAWWWVALT